MEQTIALVTGGSGGLGMAITGELRRRGYPVLVADLVPPGTGTAAAAPDIGFFSIDLSGPDAPEQLFGHCRDRGFRVEVLVNNAGFGIHGRLLDQDPAEVERQLRVHVNCPTRLSILFGREMRARGKGYILNIGSLSSFQPIPAWATCAASKAFLLSFSEALYREMRPAGVMVTALCPSVVDTPFFSRAAKGRGFRFRRIPRLAPLAAEKVAATGVAALFRGKMTVVPGLFQKTWLLVIRLLPRRTAVWIAGKMPFVRIR